MAYSILAENKNERELEELDVAIGMIEDPAEEAKQALREYQRRAGITFENPDAPVAADPNSLADLPDEYMR